MLESSFTLSNEWKRCKVQGTRLHGNLNEKDRYRLLQSSLSRYIWTWSHEAILIELTSIYSYVFRESNFANCYTNIRKPERYTLACITNSRCIVTREIQKCLASFVRIHLIYTTSFTLLFVESNFHSVIIHTILWHFLCTKVFEYLS